METLRLPVLTYKLIQKRFSLKEAPYGSAYFWTFRQYVRINKYVMFFSTWQENIASVEYIEAIFDTVSVTIAT